MPLSLKGKIWNIDGIPGVSFRLRKHTKHIGSSFTYSHETIKENRGRDSEIFLVSPYRWRIEPCVSWGAAISESEVQDEWVRLDCDTMLGVRCMFSEEQGDI